ncbi:DUF3899 domain-containing protein [Brevibacillus massiliensis]|jgi:hypothetical protein|uniref:DUF3899 domain-containing protein n=1 Tax=Brevibacillus massiliensis TaxID=1118054 RepID=UPI0002ECC311|nr:DUF3899 domain-containing protein [Brevibacillus massiliensis]
MRPSKTAPVVLTLAVLLVLTLTSGSRPGGLLPLINKTFLLGLLLLVAGGLIVVANSGFFTLFAQGFRQIARLFFRKPRVMESDFFADDPASEFIQHLKSQAAFWAISSGLTLAVCSVLLTFYYYAFAI